MPDTNPFQNPFGDSPNPYRSAHYAQRTSALAILSVISGLLSFPLMCLCFLSMPISIFAIVCGHMSRGIVRQSNGGYSGIEMATFGMVLGYASLFIMGGMLTMGLLSTTSKPRTPRVPVDAPSATVTNPGEVLLRVAEGRLLAADDAAATGVSTTEGSATALAQHYIETLQVLDATHFAETNEDVAPAPRDYHVFAQLNKDSIAFLVLVPEFNRFTPAARDILRERCWLIAQRSVDDLLVEGASLAVAIYSDSGPQHIMIGVTARHGSWRAGLENPDAAAEDMAAFFQLADRAPNDRPDAESPIDSQIDTRAAPAEVTLPAEADEPGLRTDL